MPVIAVIAEVPLPFSTPVRVEAPVPPLETASCPLQPKVKILVPTEPVTLVSLVMERDWTFLFASVPNKAVAVVEGMLMLFPLVTCKARMPVEEATLNISKAGWVDVPWTVKVASAVVVPNIAEPLTPTLNKEMPVEVLT